MGNNVKYMQIWHVEDVEMTTTRKKILVGQIEKAKLEYQPNVLIFLTDRSLRLDNCTDSIALTVYTRKALTATEDQKSYFYCLNHQKDHS